MTRVLLAQINTTVGDFEGNTQKILEAIEVAKKKNCSLVVTPELALSGYPPNDLLYFDHFLKANASALEKVRQSTRGITLVLGCFRKNNSAGKPLYNSAAVIRDGHILDYADKCLLPTYDVFKERRYFEPGRTSKTFEHEGLKIGLTLCEDIWDQKLDSLYSVNPLERLRVQNPDLHINLSASPFCLGKFEERLEVAKTASWKLQCPTLYCNQVGGNDTLIFDGHSFACDADKLLDLALGYQEDHFVVDTDALSAPSLNLDPTKELYQALCLGIRDFFHKQNFKKAIIGLSGGIDSAVVTTLAAHALGPQNILAISMPSRFSSAGSINDAKALCSNLEVELKEVPLESVHAPFLDLLEPHLKGHAQDATEENLQARLRGIILMAFSNKFNDLVISCGNKSEIAMGYTTLYGDLTGGLSALSDVYKTQVYEIARFVNKDREIIPKAILEKAPSAELRPNQKDSDSLPEYDLLDPLIEAYVEDHLSPEEIASKLEMDLSYVEKLIQKIHRAEFKRRQAPIGLRVTTKAFSLGWEFPIVQKWNK